MFCGTASRLTLYENGILHLEIRVPGERGGISVEQLARNIAISWSNGVRLNGATGYKVHIYKANHPAGFVVDTKGSDSEVLAKTLVATMKAAAKPRPDILLEIVEGDFENE
ncbi:MAG: hypothetical protein NTV93_20495 [Verrucomicrobia bacterium]|nr:hypothetical protein [Verrucomicrobiota bacterium]